METADLAKTHIEPGNALSRECVLRLASSRQIRSPTDEAVTLYIPKDDIAHPEISIVVPAMNERISIGQFISWCKQGIAEVGQPIEMLIVDSSADETPEIALQAGARVLRTPKRGLGRAYIDAIPFIRGKFVIMGDADCTYDFRQVKAYVEAYLRGAEFVMGSRFKGTIEPEAMPALHRYFGTPLTTMILNFMYGTKFSDIHCGMRGITRDALVKIGLTSQSWEYASEMVLKSVHAELRSTEVPIDFFKDMHGRQSHMVRGGWLEPWRAGWVNLRAMFTYGADFFLLVPGTALLLAGLVGLAALSVGPLQIGRYYLSLNTMLFALVAAVQGANMVLLAYVARCLYDGLGKTRKKLLRLFEFTRTVLLCCISLAVSIVLMTPFVTSFVLRRGLYDSHTVMLNHLAIVGLFLMALSLSTFVAMLLMHALDLYLGRAARPDLKTSTDVS